MKRRTVLISEYLFLLSEAGYAFNTGKQVLALQLESGYKPDGWLGKRLKDKPTYDFSVTKELDTKWENFEVVLRNLIPNTEAPNTGLLPLTLMHTIIATSINTRNSDYDILSRSLLSPFLVRSGPFKYS